MPTALPAATDYTAAANQAAKKTFMTSVRTFLADLLGTDGTAASARTAMGAAASGLATASGLTLATGKILGRTTAATGAVEELDETLYARTNRAQTYTAKQTFTATQKVQQALEKITITAGAPAATQHFDFLTQAVEYFTSAGANNWTLNVRGDAGTTLDSLMAAGECATITVEATMTGTPYYASAMTIDGNAVTPKWIGGTAPTSGDASCINIYSYSITKTAAATFTVIASKAKTS